MEEENGLSRLKIRSIYYLKIENRDIGFKIYSKLISVIRA